MDRSRVMGVLNVTPDSFADGGRFLDSDVAIRHGLGMIEEGADLLDVGGESTRPGSEGISAAEEWRRIGTILETLARKTDAPISVDTRKPEVAEKAIRAGASIVNDVSGLRNPAMVRTVARGRVGVVVMHMLGEPKTMQERPRYDDVVREVRSYLADRAQAAIEGGVPSESIALDPGIGFGKTLEHNLELLGHLDLLGSLGHPIVVGASRKSFLAKLGAGEVPDDRLAGSLAVAAFAIFRGAHIVRAHDVRETVVAMRVLHRLARR